PEGGTTTVTTIFERLDRGRPTPVEKKTKQPEAAAQLLLDWLTQRWRKNIISRRDISNHGPRPIRERQAAIDAAETLERHGWPTPPPTHRHDRRWWQIVSNPVVRPTVAE